MRVPAYAIARAVAPKVREHLRVDLSARGGFRLGPPAPEADAEAIEAMLDAGFWASLRHEEGRSPTISLAFLPPSQAGAPLTFEAPLPLAPEPLTRLSPAVERPGIHLGVWRQEGELQVWGATRTLPPFCFVLEVVAPGLLVVKHSRGEDMGKFANIAVIEGDQVKVLDPEAAARPDTPALVAALLGLDLPVSPPDHVNVLAQLAASMRAHKRGGTLLVVPANTETWRESMVQPIRYLASPAFSRLAETLRGPQREGHHRRWEEALERAVEGIAGLTAVDGATVITDQYDLVAFGAMIGRRSGGKQIEQVVVTEPVEGFASRAIAAAQLGGTRHLSAAQFANDQRDAAALVASKDGQFTVFGWSPSQGMVQAHRVEALLM